MNRYLNGNSLHGLLEVSHPAVKYLALRDLIGESGPRLDSAYAEMRATPLIQEILSSANNGVLGDIGNFASIGNGSAWRLALAVTCGLDLREPCIEKTIVEIFSRWQTESGGIAGRWKPRHPDACLTGEMLRIAKLAGLSDERTARAAAWILDHQRNDGGWLHSPVAGFGGMAMFFLFNRSEAGLSRESDPSVSSCIVATTSCALALISLGSGDERITRTVRRASEFLLSHRLSSPDDTVVTPCNSNLDLNEKHRIGFPVFCQYDILHGMLCIARAGLFDDLRTGEPFNAIMMRQSPEGTVPYDNYGKGMLFMKREGSGGNEAHDWWSTLNFLRILKSARAL